MTNWKLIASTLAVFAGLILYPGCASSSNSIRYHEPENENNQVRNTVRFTSKDDPQSSEDKKRLTNADTSSYDYVDALNSNDDDDNLPEDEPKVDLTSVLQRYSSGDNQSDMSANMSTKKEQLLMEIIKYLNTPYKYGGNSKNGIDCSAFTQTLYDDIFNTSIARTAREQYKEGEVINDVDNLQPGDLVFFNTRRRVKPGHVGIYIGDRLFAHASSRHGVIVSSIDYSYYAKRFMGGRRIEDVIGSNNF